MARTGFRFDRFYAGAPNCGPTQVAIKAGLTSVWPMVRWSSSPTRSKLVTQQQSQFDWVTCRLMQFPVHKALTDCGVRSVPEANKETIEEQLNQ